MDSNGRVDARRFDRRANHRYPAWMEATIETGNGKSPQFALVTDISLTGLQLETDVLPEAVDCSVRLAWRDMVCTLPVDTSKRIAALRGATLHCRFHKLDESQLSFVVGMIDGLRRQFEQAQANLVSGRFGPRRV
jgi:hypothetical protein